jgi:hypothetical protein
MAIFYSVVKDDPLSSGGNSRVVEGWNDTIECEDGQTRYLAYLGQRAWCDACRSFGVIVAAPDSPDTDRMHDQELNARQALGGDLVMCKCAQRPVVIARYGRSWTIETGGNASVAAGNAATVPAASAQESSFDDRFVLRDANGQSIASAAYVVQRETCDFEYGETDEKGHTHLLSSVATAESIRVFLAG